MFRVSETREKQEEKQNDTMCFMTNVLPVKKNNILFKFFSNNNFSTTSYIVFSVGVRLRVGGASADTHGDAQPPWWRDTQSEAVLRHKRVPMGAPFQQGREAP